MAATVNATATAAAVTTSATTLTNSSLTVAAGATSLLAWLMFDEISIIPSSVVVRWDSAGTPQTMTLLVEAEDPANTNTRVQLYGLVAPTLGNRSLTATWTSAVPAILDAISFSGTATSSVANVFKNTASNTGTSGVPTLSLTSAVGSLSIAGVGAVNTVTSFAATGSTTVFNTTDTNGFGFVGARAPGAATVAWTGAPTSIEWAAAGVDVTAASAVSRDFGTSLRRPESREFSLAFGPGVPADPNLEFKTTVTRDFGAILHRPESSAFSMAFGPGVVGDNNLAFSTTVVRDYASPVEPRFSARRDVVVPLGTDATTLIVTSGPIIVAEWLRTINSAGGVVPAEWRRALSRDTDLPDTTSTFFAFNQIGPIEWGLSVLRSTIISTDFNMSRQALPAMFAEWRMTCLRDDTAAIEPDALTIFEMPVPTEWVSSTVLATATMPVEMGATWRRDHATPAEIPGSALSAATVPLDWGQPAQMSTSFAVPLEFVSRVFQVHPEPLEFSTARVRDVTTPAEWAGSTATTLDADAPAEWRGPAVVDADAAIEWRTTFTVDAVAPSAWVSTILADPETAPEMTLSIVGESFIIPDADAGVRTEDLTATTSWSATILRDAVVPFANAGSATGATGDADAPLSFGGGLASTPWEVPLEAGAGRRADAPVTSAWLSLMLSEPETAAEMTLSVVGESFIVPDTSFDIITEDHAAPVEWSAVAVTADATFEIECLTVTVADADGSADWFGSTLSADTVALIEWTQDTATASADAEAPVDFLSMIVTDATAPIERRRRHRTIGARLEPDEWEREHD